MSIKMQVFKSGTETTEGWDISELVHDIEYTTSIMGQAGKLSFVIERDTGNSDFQIGVGYCVMFWHNDLEVFKGYVFTVGTDRTEAYKVTAYDQMRYLQNHDSKLIQDMTIEDVFKMIAQASGIKNENVKIVGNVDKSIKIKEKVFTDSSYFDILQYAIDWTNSYAVTSEVERLQEIKQGDEVYFNGGYHYTSPNDTRPVGGIRTAGTAKITEPILPNALHPYHLKGISAGGTSNVYGWVDKNTFITNEKLNQLMDNFYYVRDNFGTLELRETKYCGTYDENGNKIENWLIIGDESLLTDYQYEVDIDRDTFNEFFFMYNPKDKQSKTSNQQVQQASLIGAIQAGTKIQRTGTKLDGTTIGEDTIPKWGKLRKIVTVNDISDKDLLAEYMKINVENFNQPTRSLRLTALGYDGVYAGDTFHLLLGKLKLDRAVYVLNATHHYEANLHTMELEVNTSPDIKVFC